MIITFNGTSRYVSYGRQDSEYDDTLAEHGMGDVHPSRRVQWWRVAVLICAAMPWTIIIIAICKILHRH